MSVAERRDRPAAGPARARLGGAHEPPGTTDGNWAWRLRDRRARRPRSPSRLRDADARPTAARGQRAMKRHLIDAATRRPRAARRATRTGTRTRSSTRLRVRSFYDSNGDGIGDFRGLAAKLDYLQDLGVTALWLLPFYPSPLRDDGYDIADYTDVHPDVGTLADFELLPRARRTARGLRVITELVLNHTSDQHPWFQRARRAPPGSAERDFYVWSDTPERYQDARIIFKDFEPSNWAWDPVAQRLLLAPLLRPPARSELREPGGARGAVRGRRLLVRAWASTGCGSTRCPTSTRREGTNCENLPETHAFLKKLRAHVDARFPDRMLLAEANQWPEDAAAYFGDGDECHMNFHFPIMPRMFMAIHMEDRFPIIDILAQTPQIPDELPVGAVPAQPRRADAGDGDRRGARLHVPRLRARAATMRINLGIRRRLAPLVGNDRRKMELLNGAAVLAARHAGPLLRRRDRDGRQRLPRRPQRRAHADAVERRPQRRLLARQPAAADPADHHRPRVPLRGDQRRGAAEQPELAAVVDEAPHRAAQAVPGVRARHDRVPDARRTRACWRSSRAATSERDDPGGRQPVALRRSTSSWICRSGRGCARSSCSGTPSSRPSASCPTCSRSAGTPSTGSRSSRRRRATARRRPPRTCRRRSTGRARDSLLVGDERATLEDALPAIPGDAPLVRRARVPRDRGRASRTSIGRWAACYVLVVRVEYADREAERYVLPLARRRRRPRYVRAARDRRDAAPARRATRRSSTRWRTAGRRARVLDARRSGARARPATGGTIDATPFADAASVARGRARATSAPSTRRPRSATAIATC